MVSGIWGKKIGMTQVFSGDKSVPVTVIDVGNWVVTAIKTKERDGYAALQVGCVKKRHVGKTPTAVWMKQPRQYFTFLREIRVSELPKDVKVGQAADFYTGLQEGELVDVRGTTKGRGFAGVVKRWNFGGPPASHGHTMGKTPGSLGFMCSQGKVIKGKKMPGHMGVEKRFMKNLDIVKIDQEGPVILVKGSVPGYNGSLVFVRKHAE